MPLWPAKRTGPPRRTRLDAVLEVGMARLRLKGPAARSTGMEPMDVDGLDELLRELKDDDDVVEAFAREMPDRPVITPPPAPPPLPPAPPPAPPPSAPAPPSNEEKEAMAKWNERGLNARILELYAELNAQFPVRLSAAWTERLMLVSHITSMAPDSIEAYFVEHKLDDALTGGMRSGIYDTRSEEENVYSKALGPEKMARVRAWIKANMRAWPTTKERFDLAKSWGWDDADSRRFIAYTSNWMKLVKNKEHRALKGVVDKQVEEVKQRQFVSQFQRRANELVEKAPQLGFIGNDGALYKTGSVLDEVLASVMERVRIKASAGE